MHEQGQADHELIDDHERDRFAGTSADTSGASDTRADAGTGTDADGGRDKEFEQGREVGHEEERSERFGEDQPSDSPGSRRA